MKIKLLSIGVALICMASSVYGSESILSVFGKIEIGQVWQSTQTFYGDEGCLLKSVDKTELLRRSDTHFYLLRKNVQKKVDITDDCTVPSVTTYIDKVPRELINLTLPIMIQVLLPNEFTSKYLENSFEVMKKDVFSRVIDIPAGENHEEILALLTVKLLPFNKFELNFAEVFSRDEYRANFKFLDTFGRGLTPSEAKDIIECESEFGSGDTISTTGCDPFDQTIRSELSLL